MGKSQDMGVPALPAGELSQKGRKVLPTHYLSGKTFRVFGSDNSREHPYVVPVTNRQMDFFKRLFNRQPLTLASLAFDAPGWQVQETNLKKQVWEHPGHSAVLSLPFFAVPPDIPVRLDDQMGLRDHYRSLIHTQHGGLVEVAVGVLANTRINVVKTIFKVPRQPRGMGYIGSLTVPFKHCSYVVKIQAEEAGMTGMREAVIADKLIREGKIVPGENTILGWSADPYDRNWKKGALMNLAEREEYDPLFPGHPLTIVRDGLKAVAVSMKLTKELLRAERF